MRLAIFATVLCAGIIFAGGEASAQTRYHVSTAGDGVFLVEVELAHPSAQFIQRTPSSPDRPLSTAESVRDISGVTAAGRSVALHYTTDEDWLTDNRVAVVGLRYAVVADNGDAEWEHGREEVAARFDHTFFFIGGVFFLIDPEQLDQAAAIDFDLPHGWSVTSPWARHGDYYTVERQLDIFSNAFAMGADAAQHVHAGGVDLTWLMSEDLQPIAGRVTALMHEMPAAFTEFFVRVAAPAGPLEQIVLSQLISHETLHLWLGANRIHGDNPNDIYWFTEGFTDYITVKLMRERGLISRELRDQRLANFVRRDLLGRQRSPDVTLSEAGAHKGANFAWVYGGGAFVALLLDAEMSRADPNGFRDMMRDLYRHGDQPYTLESLMARMDAASNGRASEIVAFVQSSPGIPEVRARLAGDGIDMAGFTEDEIYLHLRD